MSDSGDTKSNPSSKKNEFNQSLNQDQIKSKSVSKLAGLMSIGTLLSRILGFIRDRLIVQFFDVQISDAFYAAFRLPNFFRILLGEGALSVSFLPAYVELKEKAQLGGTRDESVLAGTVWSFLSILSASVSALGVLYMTELLPYIVDVEQISKIPGKYEATLLFSQIMFAYLFLASQFAFFMSVLNSHDEFFIPGLAPAIFNLIVIVVILINPQLSRLEGDALPLAILLGGVGQALVVFLKSYTLKIIPKPNFLFRNPNFLKVIKRAAPSMVGISAMQFMGVLNLGFASSLKSGSITFLYLADRLLELPQSILAISLGAALLPRLSSYWAKNDIKGFVNQIYSTTSVYYFLAVPSAVGLIVLAEPIVSLLFATKNLTTANIQTTASLVQVYGVMLLINGTSKLMLPGFYAVKNTVYPAIASCFIITIHYFLAPILMKEMGLMGLVISTTFSSLLALIITFVSFQILVTKISIIEYFRPVPKIVLLNIPTLILSIYTLKIWQEQTSNLLKNVYLVIGITITVVLYFILAILFNFDQIEAVRKRIFKKKSMQLNK